MILSIGWHSQRRPLIQPTFFSLPPLFFSIFLPVRRPSISSAHLYALDKLVLRFLSLSMFVSQENSRFELQGHSQISAAMKDIVPNLNFVKTPAIIKVTALAVVALSCFYLGKHYSDGYQQLSFFSTFRSPQTGSAVGVSPSVGKFFDQNLNLTAPRGRKCHHRLGQPRLPVDDRKPTGIRSQGHGCFRRK